MTGAYTAVQEVLYRYHYGVDIRDVDLILSCFAPEVELSYLNGAVLLRTRDEARDFFANKEGHARLGIRASATSHVLANLRVTPTDDGADVVSNAVIFISGARVDGTNVVLRRGVTYADRFARDGDSWLITRREHVTRWQHVARDDGPAGVPV